MKKYLLAALLVVGAPLFAADDAPAEQEDALSHGAYFGVSCLSPLHAAGIGMQELLEQVRENPEEVLAQIKALFTDEGELGVSQDNDQRAEDLSADNNHAGNLVAENFELQEENARLRAQLSEADRAVAAAIQRELDPDNYGSRQRKPRRTRSLDRDKKDS
jgi:regulator of replication initiation timing